MPKTVHSKPQSKAEALADRRPSPEGYAYIDVCPRCDSVCIRAYYMKDNWVRLSSLAVPAADAIVLSRYWENLYVLVPDIWTRRKMNGEGRPVRFQLKTWVRGNRAYIPHRCYVRR